MSLGLGLVDLPPTAVSPVAAAAASRAKSFAGFFGILAVLFSIAAIAMPSEKKRHRYSSDSAYEAGEVAGRIIACGAFLIPTFFFVRRARRATAASQRAAADKTWRWTLVGKLVVAYDDRGAPRPELSFKTTAGQRAMLLAATMPPPPSPLPSARVVT
jgi:hypothetical protein